jgi:hypothetical protein
MMYGLAMLGVVVVSMYAVVKFVQGCAGDDNAD